MKPVLYLALVALLPVAACRKTATPPRMNGYAGRPQPYTGTAAASKDGQPWSAYVYAFRGYTDPGYESRYTISLENYGRLAGDTFRKDQVSFHYVKPEAYTTALVGYLLSNQATNPAADKTENCHLVSQEYDVPLDAPSLIPSTASFLRIESYNTDTRQFTGTFSLDFLSGNLRDTIRFRNGTFSGRVYNDFFPE